MGGIRGVSAPASLKHWEPFLYLTGLIPCYAGPRRLQSVVITVGLPAQPVVETLSETETACLAVTLAAASFDSPAGLDLSLTREGRPAAFGTAFFS